MPNLFTEFAKVTYTLSESFWDHVIVAVIVAIPSTIAALSSLRNGRRLEDHHDATKMKANHTTRAPWLK